jgi:hypothetical protein
MHPEPEVAVVFEDSARGTGFERCLTAHQPELLPTLA